MVSPTIQTYFSKMKGQRHDPKRLKSPPKPPTRIQVLVSTFVGSFIGIAIVASMTYNSQWFLDRNTPVITGSFGASAVLIYGAIEAPLSQPRNVIGGHIMSSFIGISLYKLFNLMSTELFNRLHWLLCSLAVSISLFVMQVTHTVHPPASASALIAVTGGQAIYDLGYWFLLCPIALGVALMMTVAMIVNNVVRTYPSHWWAPKSRIIHVVDQDMTTTIADFVPPDDDDDDEDEDEQEKEGQEAGRDGVTSSPLGNNPTISSSSSLTFSPLNNHSSPNHPPTSITPQPAPITHTHAHAHAHPQYAVYYGGDHKEELRDGETLQELHSGSSSSPKDLEHGHGPHGPTNRRHSILVGVRGSTHPIARTTSSGTTVSHVTAMEEEYRATIEQLQQRILDLESRLAAAPADTGAGSN
ncbi:hypothetical protein EC957_009571 [Mortierella hygrophila]|uniref:HPP transmembrane region domain-containing protein n=1 Tax=Mortierella hygrophila TaxID=979708 RepID=A0A9P6FAA5_9FUNG|nr:hypothetical protein EC957_009571 [Mortierella hygrophila]